MENNTGKGDHSPAIAYAAINLCTEMVADPVFMFVLRAPLTFIGDDGVAITIPRLASIYMSSFELGEDFAHRLMGIAAEAQKEEELRWLRMTEEEVARARAAYIPF